MPHTLSASIVTYNNSTVISDTLTSLYKHCNTNSIDLYVVDNASSDDCVQVVKQFDPSISLIQNNENIGFGAAHNKVLPLIDSKYHAIINPDIVFEEDTLQELIDYLDAHPDVIMISPRILNLDYSEQALPKLRPKLKYLISRRSIFDFEETIKLREEYTRSNECINNPTDIEFCTGCFFIIRTKAFKQLEGFDEDFFLYFEDADLTQRVLKLGRVVFNPTTYVLHRWARDSQRDYRPLNIHIQSMIKFFNKHGW